MAGTSTQHVPPVKKFKGTNEFQKVAKFFIENGSYTLYPKGSDEYINFWKDEDKKCREGMTNSYGISITPIHYFYLNYVQIRSEDKLTKRKIYQAPRFLSIDYDYFWLIEACRKQDKDLILVKPRRTGFTLKSATLITYEYNFYRGSTCVVGAYLDRLSSTTMNAVLDNMNFLNLHTEWKKARNPDTKDIVKARYQENLGGTTVWKGYMSEVRKITFKDNAFASIGLSTSIYLFEEAGTFSNLIDSFGVTKPCWVDGENKIGLCVMQGTGGSMEGGTRDFCEIFYNPRQYGFLEFNNIWEEEKSTTCGWFIPATRGKLGEYKDELKRQPEKKGMSMVDEEGNDDEDLALEAIMDQRTIARMGSNPQILKDAITQFPLTPSESFLRSSKIMFSSPEMLEWLGKLETTPSLRNSAQKGELIWQDGKLKWMPNDELNYITQFPLRRDDDPTGAIVIWEHPEEVGGEIPYALYIASQDNYDMDKAENGSLGSFFVYKRFYKAGATHDLIVAEYTGRPQRATDFYENCRKLSIYYNAKCLMENMLKGYKNYMAEKNCLHYLWTQPDNVIKEVIKDSKVQRTYGVHVSRGTSGNSGILDTMELYLREWLYTERYEENGDVTLNLHTIKSIPLLKELILYDGELNTDRVSSFMLAILQTKELHKIHVQSMTSNNNTWSQDPFLQKQWQRARITNQKYNNLKLN